MKIFSFWRWLALTWLYSEPTTGKSFPPCRFSAVEDIKKETFDDIGCTSIVGHFDLIAHLNLLNWTLFHARCLVCKNLMSFD